jgi:hypothetical protein
MYAPGGRRTILSGCLQCHFTNWVPHQNFVNPSRSCPSPAPVRLRLSARCLLPTFHQYDLIPQTPGDVHHVHMDLQHLGSESIVSTRKIWRQSSLKGRLWDTTVDEPARACRRQIWGLSTPPPARARCDLASYILVPMHDRKTTASADGSRQRCRCSLLPLVSCRHLASTRDHLPFFGPWIALSIVYPLLLITILQGNAELAPLGILRPC